MNENAIATNHCEFAMNGTADKIE